MKQRTSLVLLALFLPRSVAAQSAPDESSNPDGVQPPDRTIYIIYDHQRYTLNREGKKCVGSVQMAVFRVDDVRAGHPLTDQVRLRNVITQLREE